MHRSIPAQRPIKAVEIVAGFPDLPVTMFPDITILDSTQTPELVIDAKYKRAIETGKYGRSFDNDNIFQIITYAKAARRTGMLVYPQIDEAVDVSMKIDDVHFGILTIDLSGEVREALTRFARCIATMIQNSSASLGAIAS